MSNMSKQDSTNIAKQNNAGSTDTSYDQGQGHTAKAQCAPDRSSDFVTAARTADGKLMTKVFFVDDEGREQTRSYDNGYLFYFRAVRITCLADLACTLNRLNRYTCVIYGKLIENTPMPCRRRLRPDAETGYPATIEDAAHF